MTSHWAQALSRMADGPCTPTHEMWFLKTEHGRFVRVGSRIRREYHDCPPDGFYENLEMAIRIAESARCDLICEIVDAGSVEEAWAKIMKIYNGIWEEQQK